jgi:hypothetical protein
MRTKHYPQINTYKPNYLKLIGLSLRSANYKPGTLKWLLVIATIIFLVIGIVIRVGHQLLTKNPELLSSLKEAGLMLGLVEPSPNASPYQPSPVVRLREEKLHVLDPLAKSYLEFSRESASSQAKPDRPWLLQGLADEVSKDPENRRIIKQWINSLKQGNTADELDGPDEP